MSVQIHHPEGSWPEVILNGVMVGFVWNDLFIASGQTGVGLDATALRAVADLLEEAR